MKGHWDGEKRKWRLCKRPSCDCVWTEWKLTDIAKLAKTRPDIVQAMQELTAYEEKLSTNTTSCG